MMRGRGHLDAASAELVGTVLLAKWRIIRSIARGGTSTVYEAVHRNGRRAAVKVLHPTLAADKTGRARFLRESLLANRVNHPSVVPVIDDDVAADGTVFLVMDLLEGETLDQRWKRCGRVLSIQQTLSILAGILDPLAAVHRVGIVHRDLKPSNVFLSSGVKLLDFGVACLRETSDDDGTLTRSGSMLGTPAFMAPEQARGHWHAVDARTDLWAVGAIGFSLLAGRFVHEGSTPHDLLIATATQTPLSLARVAPAVPSAVVELVDKALRLNKADRWSDAPAMLAAVRAAQTLYAEEGEISVGAISSTVSGSSPDAAITMVTSPDTEPLSRRAAWLRCGLSPVALGRLPAPLILGCATVGFVLYAVSPAPLVRDHGAMVDVAPRLPQPITLVSARQERHASGEDPRATLEPSSPAIPDAIRAEQPAGRASKSSSVRTGRLHATDRSTSHPASQVAAASPTPSSVGTLAGGNPDGQEPTPPIEKMQQTFSGIVVDDDELDRRR
jgi:serine/threonine-protein kinase